MVLIATLATRQGAVEGWVASRQSRPRPPRRLQSRSSWAEGESWGPVAADELGLEGDPAAEVDSIAALCLKGVDPEEVAEIGHNAVS